MQLSPVCVEIDCEKSNPSHIIAPKYMYIYMLEPGLTAATVRALAQVQQVVPPARANVRRESSARGVRASYRKE